MAPSKEPSFFALDEHGRYPDLGLDAPKHLVSSFESSCVADLDDYRSLFADAGDQPIVGEVSPIYISTPRAPVNLKRHVPNAKLVAMLRQPAELIYSAFHMMQIRGFDPAMSFRSALPLGAIRATLGWRWNLYINQALHGQNLRRFTDHFPSEQLKVVLLEDFALDCAKILEEICDFLGVEGAPETDTSIRHNEGYQHRVSYALRRRVSRYLPLRLRDRLRPLVAGRLNRRRRAIPTTLRREYTTAYFREDIQLLEGILDRDLAHWLA